MENIRNKTNEQADPVINLDKSVNKDIILKTDSGYPPDESCKNSYSITIADNHLPQNETEDEEDYSLLSFIPNCRNKKGGTTKKYQEQFGWWLKSFLTLALGCSYVVFVFAVIVIPTQLEKEDYWCSGDGMFFVLSLIFSIGFLYFKVVKPAFKLLISKKLQPITNRLAKLSNNKCLRLLMKVLVMAAVITFLILDTAGNRQRLVSALGFVVIVALGFIFSNAPRKIIWRQVLSGLGLEFAMGLLILRWSTGRAIFQCLSGKIQSFLSFTDEGSSFIYGDLLVFEKGVFAFQILSVVLFFSFIIQVLYYYGVMQWVVIKLGWCLQVTIGTTACESVNAAANIFLGQSEAPLLIKPYLSLLTESELHAVMTGGFATIAGTVLAAYISFGVKPAHLISASVMNAPAALAFSKLFYPETKKSKTSAKDLKIEKGKESNWLHAAMIGVTNAIPLVANIGANLLAFIAFIAFVNSFFNWTCMLVGADDGTCSLENVFGYMFMPLAWTMGVEWSECKNVGQLIGTKIMVNEFVAYQQLVQMVKDGTISVRSEVIATFACCGFSNISSIGVNLGAFSAMAPDRRSDLAKVVVRAMISGSAACFLTACIAGMLLDEI
ncbi:unnamed protein product [Meganyctiphanes norvegica]|uniref:Sodium/nucleoside cotransporter n=1 Tax=Meganyctiphanes norvegica TaxID=48144 RepID=A0AAV2RMI7_MEGNR